MDVAEAMTKTEQPKLSIPTAACLLAQFVLNGSYIYSGTSERGRNLCVTMDYMRIMRD